MNEDEQPQRLGQVQLRGGDKATAYVIRTGGRAAVFFPIDENYPDAGRKSSVEGEFDGETFRIHRLDTGSRFEKQGLARSLLGMIAVGLGAKEIIALSPSEEARKKKFYENTGFKPLGRDMVWKRK
jgi:GNAT superfamily N-acetyltransferase